MSDRKIENRFASLDGWRGVSILLVLAAHLLPLGPKDLDINNVFGKMGMALFFTLSGFLMTGILLRNDSVLDFLIRRFFRIIPLAWVYITITMILLNSPVNVWLAHLFFYANWPPMDLTSVTSHLWSLCVEMQFYIGIALLVACFSKKGLYLIPLICIVFTFYRYINGVYYAINTYYRVDEILVGCILSLIYNRKLGSFIYNLFKRSVAWVFILFLIISSHSAGEWMNYFRPYFAAILIGTTLINENSKFSRWLDNRFLVYIAAISYALYVIHPILSHMSWLGQGEGIVKYAKRPLLLVALFTLAHISTFYFENRCIAMGKRLSAVFVKKR